MVLLRLLLIINLITCIAQASGEVGFSPSRDFNNNNQNQKYFFNVYEKLWNNYYINPYFERINEVNLTQNYFKLDINKHITDNVIIGLGAASTNNNYFTRNEVRANLILKVW